MYYTLELYYKPNCYILKFERKKMKKSINTSLLSIDRRTFLQFITIGTAALGSTAWISTLEGCSKNSNPITPPALTGQKISLILANEPDLQNVGGFIRRSFGSNANGGNEVIVMRFAVSGTGAFATASTICTHQGCAVNNPSGTTITCPCHGSVFGATSNNFATNLSGPAPSPLTTFATAFDGTTVTITF
jgi:Rieske Fe-S protein